jgi:hypothetical protein
VTFTDTVNSRSLTFGAVSFTGGGGGYGYGTATPNTGIAALNQLTANGGQGGSFVGTIGLTVTGLTVGRAYDIQVFFWNQIGQTPGEYIGDWSTDTGTWFSTAPSSDPSFVVGSFTADATTQNVGAWGGAHNNFSAILVTDAPAVPEPASIAILAVGLLGVAAIRHRRAERGLNLS